MAEALPLTLTPLVGRESDFAGVLGALSGNRLVTITGLGGVGKTALAQTLARWTWGEERAKLIWYEKSVASKEALGDKVGLAATYNSIGLIHTARGDYAAALEWYEKSGAILQEIGDLRHIADLQWNLAVLALEMGDRAQAKQYAQESVRLYEQLKLEKKSAEVRT